MSWFDYIKQGSAIANGIGQIMTAAGADDAGKVLNAIGGVAAVGAAAGEAEKVLRWLKEGKITTEQAAAFLAGPATAAAMAAVPGLAEAFQAQGVEPPTVLREVAKNRRGLTPGEAQRAIVFSNVRTDAVMSSGRNTFTRALTARRPSPVPKLLAGGALLYALSRLK